jgi:hypothetical protein
MLKPNTLSIKMVAVLLPLLLLFIMSSNAQITWPASQLLPSFPTSAQTQDLFILRETSTLWEGEGSALSHKTGRLETDGWLCRPVLIPPMII